MKIALGADHRGVHVKAKLSRWLCDHGHEVLDVGAHDEQSVDYPDFAVEVARRVSAGEAERGILICGSGIGMAITANKFRGVRAATGYDEVMAEMARSHNDVNVLCLSGDLLGERRIDRMVEIFLNTPFDAGRHARRLEKIAAIENNGVASAIHSAPAAERPPV